MSSRENTTGKKLQVPKFKIEEYVQGHIKTTNGTGEEQSVDSLYLGSTDNRCRHTIFM